METVIAWMMLSAMVHCIEELAWFSGAWETDIGKTHVEAYGTPPAGDMMIAMGVRLEKRSPCFSSSCDLSNVPTGFTMSLNRGAAHR
jgi:hypothetical protein